MSDLKLAQEFSIEIPDKEADGILSSMFSRWGSGRMATLVLILLQLIKQ